METGLKLWIRNDTNVKMKVAELSVNCVCIAQSEGEISVTEGRSSWCSGLDSWKTRRGTTGSS